MFINMYTNSARYIYIYIYTESCTNLPFIQNVFIPLAYFHTKVYVILRLQY
jgi:hypothetical protein